MAFGSDEVLVLMRLGRAVHAPAPVARRAAKATLGPPTMFVFLVGAVNATAPVTRCTTPYAVILVVIMFVILSGTAIATAPVTC